MFPPPPPTLLLPLRHLFLTDDHFYEESTLTSLLAWAPNVTSLELYYGKAARDRSEIQQRSPLAVLGAQLRHLGLWHPPVTAFDRAVRTELATSFAAALPTCVNLVSLEVRPVTQSQITDLLPLVSSRLKVLETRWRGDLEWDTLELLELPALVELKRWRIHFCEFKVQVTEDLRAACVDRGVEVRDYERFFTGESRAALSLTERTLIPLRVSADHCYE